MGFWSRLLGREAKGGMTTLELFREVYGGGRDSHAGKLVNLDTALEDDTAWACMRVITEGCAQVPWRLHQEVDGRRRVASDHPLDALISTEVNDYGLTSFEFRETILLHMLVAGNAYVFVNRVGRERRIRELVPLEPKRVSVRQRPDMTLEYTVTADDGSRRVFGRDAIWHLRGPSWNAWAGLDAVKMARNAIGLSASLEQGQSEFQKNGAKTTGIVSVEGKLDKPQWEQLSDWLAKHQIGQERSHLPMVLDRNGKFMPTAMTGVDQQLIETRRHQVESICRRFRVMPLMVGHPADMAARAATETIFIQHVVHTLMPWYSRIEQSAKANLLTEEERRQGFYTKFNANALMRGSAKDRAEYYAKALGSGGHPAWMTQNEVRGLDEFDRMDDPEADELLRPPAGSNADPTPSADDPSDDKDATDAD